MPRTKRKPSKPRQHRQSRPVPVFAALGHEARWKIVERLACQAELSIHELTGGTRLTRQAVTKHLQVLHQAGIVHPARRGREMRYRLEPHTLGTVREALERIARQWDDALLRLQAFLENDLAKPTTAPPDRMSP